LQNFEKNLQNSHILNCVLFDNEDLWKKRKR